ncbi:hypothetical protein DMB38_02310 [Streptomyces sp. WAC 06738]|uniref:L,D-transpeptidase family protein n=1 Tax=Streptomyces sp. WAC 06738 TaxID=2203210 RepID=UPI000F6EE701|nr:L,D-transpeptidase family protein [Streptomyces sp. WAC 06738]AZM44804.1 hypothetical protein DMB38_02310 [Streptomyces sp. WAC 06738]
MRAYGTSGRLPRRTAAAAVGLILLAGCGTSGGDGGDGGGTGGTGKAAATGGASASPATPPGDIPGVGARLNGKVPADSRQAVAVYGEGPDSADATVVLYEKRGGDWQRRESWPAHNGKKGWTPDHREGDKRSPVGVFTLSDAGGVLADPGAKLPYQQSPAFAAPHYWPETHWNDFDLVIAIDYNRVRGTSPLDPTRPQGQGKGGSIWFHMDHGSGTSGCVSISKSGMTTLLRTLDPRKDPVAVMGDRASLAG